MTTFYRGIFYPTFGITTPPIVPVPAIGTYGLLRNGSLFEWTGSWVLQPDPIYATFLDTASQKMYILENGQQYPKEVCGYYISTTITATLQPGGDYILSPPVDNDLSPFVAQFGTQYRCFFIQAGLWYEQLTTRFMFMDLSGSGTWLIDNTVIPATKQLFECDMLDNALLNRYVDCDISPNANPNVIIASNTITYSVSYGINSGTVSLDPQPDSDVSLSMRYSVYSLENINSGSVVYNTGLQLWTLNTAGITAFPATLTLMGCNPTGQVNVVYIITAPTSINSIIDGIPFAVEFNDPVDLAYFIPDDGIDPDRLYYNPFAAPPASVGDTIYFEGIVSGVSEVYYGIITSINAIDDYYVLAPGLLPLDHLYLPNPATTLRTANLFAVLKTAPGPYEGQHVEGINSVALGRGAHAENSSIALGDFSHAEGINTQATGNHSHAEGYFTRSIGLGAHTEGRDTYSQGDYSHTEGLNNTSLGDRSHTEGENNRSIADNSHTEGINNSNDSIGGHVEGLSNVANNASGIHVEGNNNTASGSFSHAEGSGNVINSAGTRSHIEGQSNLCGNDICHVEGSQNTALAVGSHVEGQFNLAGGDIITLAYDYYQITGPRVKFSSAVVDLAVDDRLYIPNVRDNSIILVRVTDNSSLSNPLVAVVTGTAPTTDLFYSGVFAVRKRVTNNISASSYNHVEGQVSAVSGSFGHSECNSIASGNFSHSEGSGIASGLYSHAEGGVNISAGNYTHVEGQYNWGMGSNSHVEGLYCSVANARYTTVTGTYYNFSLGNGLLTLTTAVGINVGDIIYFPNRATFQIIPAIVISVLLTVVTVQPLVTSAGTIALPTGSLTTTITLPVIVKSSVSTTTHQTNHVEGYCSASLGLYNHTDGNNLNNGSYNTVSGRGNIIDNTVISSEVSGSGNVMVNSTDTAMYGLNNSISGGSVGQTLLVGDGINIPNGTIANSIIQGSSHFTNINGNYTFTNCRVFGSNNNCVATTTARSFTNYTVIGSGNTFGSTTATTGGAYDNCLVVGNNIIAQYNNSVLMSDNSGGTALGSINLVPLSNCFHCKFTGSSATTSPGNYAYRFYTSTTLGNSAVLRTNTNAWFNPSSEEIKTKICDIDFKDYLNKFEQLRLECWKYTEGAPIEYNTPYAEDWNAIFGKNNDGFDTLELASINMGAIKGLCIRKNEMQAEIDELKSEVELLKTQVAEIDTLKADIASIKLLLGI